MLPRDVDQEAPLVSESPAPRTGGHLSSMVVKPSVSSGGSSLDTGHAADNRRRDSPPPPRHRYSPEDLHHRDSLAPCQRSGGFSPALHQGSKDAFPRRFSQPGHQLRGSPSSLHRRESPADLHPRSQRFRNDPGYIQRAGSICTPRRPRVNDGYNESDFHHRGGLRSGRRMQGERGDSRSPPSLGRVGRPYARGSHSSPRAISPSKGQFVHRNDPNLSPREGDWICLNPFCGNLNFAQQTYCNNCHKYRYDKPCGSNHSPRRGYVSPPPPINHGSKGDLIRYRSPPDDPRDSRTGLIPPRHGAKFLDPAKSDRLYFRKDDFNETCRSDRHVNGDWVRRGGDAFVSSSGELDGHPLLTSDPSIRDKRYRSRSPADRGSFVDHARDDRRYDEPDVGNGQADGLVTVNGRGHQHGVNRVRTDVK